MIQLSSQAAEQLSKQDAELAQSLVLRGNVAVKGRGSVKTFWLAPKGASAADFDTTAILSTTPSRLSRPGDKTPVVKPIDFAVSLGPLGHY